MVMCAVSSTTKNGENEKKMRRMFEVIIRTAGSATYKLRSCRVTQR